jgi:uncharacterized protein YaaN involved in tellurite resistance
MTDVTESSDPAALVLTPPAPVPAVTHDQAAAAVEVDPATAKQIDAAVGAFVDNLASLDVHSPEFESRVSSVNTLGNQEVRRSAEVSNRFLDRPVASMEKGPLGHGSNVSTSLVQLRRQVEDLDPSRHGMLEPHRLLGIIPFGDHFRDYFHKYQSAEGNLNAIIQALYRGQDELRQDNAAIEQEKVTLWALKGRLEQYGYMAEKLDAAVEQKAAALDATDPEKAKMLRQDVLFYVRQKHQDLLTQLAVDIQGYLTLDLVRKNNVELIKGVDRATTTTVSALRTAVIAAQALSSQRLVLDQITALNTTTGNLIESTSEMLKEQSGEIQTQAASATINVQQLQTAFNNIYATLDSIDSYKLTALESMRQTVDVLSGEVQKAQTYLDRVRNAPAGEAAALGPQHELSLPSPGNPAGS